MVLVLVLRLFLVPQLLGHFCGEVLVLGKIMHEMLFPTMVAAIVSFQTTKYCGVSIFINSYIGRWFSGKSIFKFCLVACFPEL